MRYIFFLQKREKDKSMMENDFHFYFEFFESTFFYREKRKGLIKMVSDLLTFLTKIKKLKASFTNTNNI